MLTMINFIIAKNLHCSAPRRGVYKIPRFPETGGGERK
jgi:hypothetical protein